MMDWCTGGASVLGAAHKRQGLPNQDAWLEEPGLNGQERFFVSVADGHGSALHNRSDVGAALAVRALQEVLNWFFDDTASLPDVAEDVHKTWLKAVDEHMKSHPGASGVVAYGTTAIAVAGNANHLLALQLGDGDLLLGFEDGRIERPFSGDDLVGEQTYSMCMDTAPQHFKHRFYERKSDADWPDFAFVSTDGVSKSFINEAAFDQVVSSYRDLMAAPNSLKTTFNALPGWLRDVTDNGSGDDATMCIATRRWQQA